MAASVTGRRRKSNGVHKNDTREVGPFTETTHPARFSQKLHNDAGAAAFTKTTQQPTVSPPVLAAA
jgi:hypothetical protein